MHIRIDDLSDEIIIEALHGFAYHFVESIFISRKAAIGDNDDAVLFFGIEEHDTVQPVSRSCMSLPGLTCKKGIKSGDRITIFHFVVVWGLHAAGAFAGYNFYAIAASKSTMHDYILRKVGRRDLHSPGR